MIRVAIIGATGYTAYESILILLRHPQAKVTYLTALPEECAPLTEVFPALQGRLDLPMEPVDLDKLAGCADVALCCLPHKVSMSFVPKLLAAGVKVVDFSADYRIRDVALYEKVYKVEHTDRENLARAAFGLPELFREKIAGAALVANPGCYPTAASLALAPLLRERLIDPADIYINAVSGVSGAGRKAALAFHFPEMNDNLFGYAVGTHRHMPEIEQILTQAAGQPVQGPAPSPTQAPAADSAPEPTTAASAGRSLQHGRSPMRRLKELRDLFRSHRSMTRAEAAATLGVSANTATKYLQQLAAEGLILRMEPNASPRTHYFELTEDNRQK